MSWIISSSTFLFLSIDIYIVKEYYCLNNLKEKLPKGWNLWGAKERNADTFLPKEMNRNDLFITNFS